MGTLEAVQTFLKQKANERTRVRTPFRDAAIEPSDQERWRNHYYSAIYAAPSYGYGPSYYEPDYYGPTYYDYGPGVMFDGPSIGVVID